LFVPPTLLQKLVPLRTAAIRFVAPFVDLAEVLVVLVCLPERRGPYDLDDDWLLEGLGFGAFPSLDFSRSFFCSSS